MPISAFDVHQEADQLGCGRSDRPDNPSLWTTERAVAELAAVRSDLGLDVFHLLGQSWGGMLSASRPYMELAPWMAICPGAAIMLVVLGFNFLGDGLRDVLDPRLQSL